MIRINCSDREEKLFLNFGRDFTERDVIRDVISKLQQKGANALANQNGSSNGAAAPAAPAMPLTPAEREWRKKLRGRKEVLKLHQKLVPSGAVSDETFWNGMKYRYKPNGDKRPTNREIEDDEGASVANDYGVPSDAFVVDNKCLIDVSTWGGTIPTPAQRHMVFMEYPFMARALAALSSKMSEDKLWGFFTVSSMVARRARSSKADAAKTAEADSMFAPFQAGDQQMAEEEKEKLAKGLARGLDLDRFDDHRSAHVLEGHTTGGEARPTKRMRGPASQGLRLMRLVNRHGDLIVREGGASNWDENSAERGRPLDDLDIEEKKQYTKLGMEKRPEEEVDEDCNNAVLGSVAHAVWSGMQGWKANVRRFEEPKCGSGAVLRSLLDRMQP